jgi:hypothetical protein
MMEPKFGYELREGLTIEPPPGATDQVTQYWLDLANNEGATQLQRVAAFILLLQQGVKVVVSVA